MGFQYVSRYNKVCGASNPNIKCVPMGRSRPTAVILIELQCIVCQRDTQQTFPSGDTARTTNSVMMITIMSVLNLNRTVKSTRDKSVMDMKIVNQGKMKSAIVTLPSTVFEDSSQSTWKRISLYLYR